MTGHYLSVGLQTLLPCGQSSNVVDIGGGSGGGQKPIKIFTLTFPFDFNTHRKPILHRLGTIHMTDEHSPRNNSVTSKKKEQTYFFVSTKIC